MEKELIIIKQLPIIEEQLKELADTIDLKCETLSHLEVNEETVIKVKKIKAEFNKELKAMEEKRKAIKTQVLAPYEEFEKVYNELVKNKYQIAEEKLSTKIKEVEDKLKAEKEAKIKAHFEKTNNTFIKYEDLKINILLSTSIKEYEEQIKDAIDKTNEDLKLIETYGELAPVIMLEYKKERNLARSIATVQETQKAIAEIKQDVAVAEEVKIEQIKAEEVEETEEHTFTIVSTKKQYEEIQNFIKKIGAKITTIDW